MVFLYKFVTNVIQQQPLRSLKSQHYSTCRKCEGSESAYTIELAAPGIKKEYCRVSINDDGNLCIATEKGGATKSGEFHGGHEMEHKDED